MSTPAVDGTFLPPADNSIEEKTGLSASEAQIHKDGVVVADSEVETPHQYDGEQDSEREEIIVTGSDAAKYLLPLRDDGDPAITFRGLFLATVLSAFQAVMSQIYNVGVYLANLTLKLPHKTYINFIQVQTHLHHNSRHLYRHHRILSWYSMGSFSTSWRPLRGTVERAWRAGEAAALDTDHITLQLWAVESEGARCVCYYRNLCLQCV